MTDTSRLDTFRMEGLRAAAQRRDVDGVEGVIKAAGRFSDWLASFPDRIVVGRPYIAEQATPTIRTIAPRKEAGMPTVMTDAQIATYPAASDVDSKGFAVSGETITLTSDDTAGAIATQVDNADGTSAFTAVAPGVVTLTWSDGTLSLVDTLQVVAGDAASLQVGPAVITDQA